MSTRRNGSDISIEDTTDMKRRKITSVPVEDLMSPYLSPLTAEILETNQDVQRLP